MDNLTTRPPLITISTQTEDIDNTGKGRDPIQPELHPQIFPLSNSETIPAYRKHLSQVFGEEFLAEATRQDRTLTPIMKMIKEKDCEALRKSNKYFYSLRKDLSITTSGCMLYDNKLVIPRSLKQFFIDAIHQTHPGQAGMLSLGNLIWFPCIHRSLASKAQACEECTRQGKNLKPIIPKQKLGKLPHLEEPNEELQMDFAGPIPFRNHTDNYYILVSVDRYSRFPTAQVFKNCDASTAIEYLEEYCKFHGIPRSLRCDQAQAFKSRDFNVHCKNNNIKLILAPAGDHRATGMVERLIQTIKRKLGVMAIDPLWSSEDITTIVSNIIQNIRLISNRITKITPFEAHFGRKPNTALSNIVTKQNKQNLSYKKIKHFASDRKLLKQPVLSPATIWDMDQDSEPELNIQYREDAKKGTRPEVNIASESHDSENAPLLSPTRTPGKIIPSKLEVTFGDKTTTLIYGKKQVARKSIARKAPEPRGTLKPQWNIIENGTITNYSPHTITLDTNNRKNTVIRRSDLAIVTQPLTPHQRQPSPPKRLIHMVACKSLREYNNNKEKIKQFCLEEKRQMKQRQEQLKQGTSTATTSAPSGENLYSHEQIVSIAKKNQRAQQQKRRTNKAQETPARIQQPQKQQEKHQFTPRRNKRHVTPQKEKGKEKPSSSDTFRTKSRAAALHQSKLHMEKQNRSFIKVNQQELLKSPTIECITISDSTENSPIKVFTSDNKYDFMITSPDSPKIPPQFESRISTPKLDKVVGKIQKLKASPKFSSSPILNITTPHGGTSEKEKQSSSKAITNPVEASMKDKKEKAQDSAPAPKKNQKENEENKPTTEGILVNERNEEHYTASPSPAKSSISDIKPSDFYEEELHK